MIDVGGIRNIDGVFVVLCCECGNRWEDVEVLLWSFDEFVEDVRSRGYGRI